MPVKFNGSLVSAYFQLIQSAFVELGKTVPDHQIEELAIFLTRTMGSESRDYHRPEHSINVALGQPPVARLASLFHDIVYLQVDPTWQTALRHTIRPFEVTAALKVNVVTCLDADPDPWLKTVAVIFGVESEIDLTTAKGLNEFLSAIVMLRKMGSFLSDTEKVMAIACIESTIPFRKVDAKGLSAADRLKARLQLASRLGHLSELSAGQIEDIIAACRSVVEKDLASFGAETPSHYLSDTWRVIFENHPAVRNSFFSVIEYRKALLETFQFLRGLHPTFLFWVDHKNASAKQQRLTAHAEENLRVATEYLRAQIVGAVLIEAIAVATGGDAPWELFMGPNKRSREHQPLTTELYLPTLDLGRSEDAIGFAVARLLKDGRALRSRFDRKEAPIAHYFYSALSAGEFNQVWGYVSTFVDRKITPEELLGKLPFAILKPFLEALEKISITRTVAIRNLGSRLSKVPGSQAA